MRVSMSLSPTLVVAAVRIARSSWSGSSSADAWVPETRIRRLLVVCDRIGVGFDR
jgi:hypothetical protein